MVAGARHSRQHRHEDAAKQPGQRDVPPPLPRVLRQAKYTNQIKKSGEWR